MATGKPRKFLLAMDGTSHSFRAFEYVAERAVRLQPSSVLILNVLAGPLAQIPGAGPMDPDPQAMAACARLEADGVTSTVLALMGDPARTIVETAGKQACDEIVLGSRGAGAVENLALGSVAYQVAHLASVPVTVVPNPMRADTLDLEDGAGPHRILLAVDGSAPSARAVDYVCALAAAGASLDVGLLNVQIPIVSRQVRRYIPGGAIERHLREEGREAMAAAAGTLREGRVEADAVVRIGHVATTIVQEAMQRGCTRIVMGTRGLGALANLALGSTALQVLHLSELPVTLVK